MCPNYKSIFLKSGFTRVRGTPLYKAKNLTLWGGPGVTSQLPARSLRLRRRQSIGPFDRATPPCVSLAERQPWAAKKQFERQNPQSKHHAVGALSAAAAPLRPPPPPYCALSRNCLLPPRLLTFIPCRAPLPRRRLQVVQHSCAIRPRTRIPLARYDPARLLGTRL